MFLSEHAADEIAWRLPRAPPPAIAGTYNVRLEHTVAQPVCRKSQDALFTEHLRDHFRDVFFPMTHVVHEAPSQVVCARWVVEYALFVSVLEITNSTTMDTTE